MTLIPALASITWTTVGVGLLNLLVGGALVSFIRSRPLLKKVDADREANLLSERAKEMQEMRDRIDRLEHHIEQKDERHISEVRELEKKQAAKDRFYEAQKALDRHSRNNLKAAFNSLLMLLKQGIAVEVAVAEVEEMRARHEAQESEEQAKIYAAAIKAGVATEFDGGEIR